MKKTIYLLICSLFAGLMLGCNSPEGPTTLLKNDCLHRSWGIHMVGEELVFAYAAAMPYGGAGGSAPCRLLVKRKGEAGT